MIATVHYAPMFPEIFHAVARALPHLAWRHHGLGALQAYLRESDEPARPEVRVHIWHPELATADMDDVARQVHDHRFDLRSTVLLGSIEHEEHALVPVAGGLWTRWRVRHARGGAAPLERADDLLYVTARQNRRMEAGETYEFPARAFHRTVASGLAVTVVAKLGQRDEPAHVMSRAGVTPEFAVRAAPDAALVRRYVDMAADAMSRA